MDLFDKLMRTIEIDENGNIMVTDPNIDFAEILNLLGDKIQTNPFFSDSLSESESLSSNTEQESKNASEVE